MTPQQKWKYAIESIRRSIRVKNNALTAFNIPPSKLLEFEETFKPLLYQYFQTPDKERAKLVNEVWEEDEKAQFWHVMGCMPKSSITKWVGEIIVPAMQAKKE